VITGAEAREDLITHPSQKTVLRRGRGAGADPETGKITRNRKTDPEGGCLSYLVDRPEKGLHEERRAGTGV